MEYALLVSHAFRCYVLTQCEFLLPTAPFIEPKDGSRRLFLGADVGWGVEESAAYTLSVS